MSVTKVWTMSNLNEPVRSMIEFGGDLTVIDPYSNDDLYVVQSSDGSSFSNSYDASNVINGGGYVGQSLVEYDGKIWFGSYDSSYEDKIILSSDASSSCSYYGDTDGIPGSGCYSLVVWDDNLWAVMWDSANPDSWDVVYYNGTSWTAITDYDGDSDIDCNYDNRYDHNNGGRDAELVVFNGGLYLFCSVYNTTDSDDTWQVWEFDGVNYDNFSKIYDSHDDEENFQLATVIEHDSELYVIGDIHHNTGNDSAIYKASDLTLTSWTTIDNTLSIGHAVDAIEFRGKILVLAEYEDTPNDLYKLYSWDDTDESFTEEESIDCSTSNQVDGSLLDWNNKLYIGVYRDIYERNISDSMSVTLSLGGDSFGVIESAEVIEEDIAIPLYLAPELDGEGVKYTTIHQALEVGHKMKLKENKLKPDWYGYYLGDTNGKVYTYSGDYQGDDGTAITSTYVSKVLDLSDQLKHYNDRFKTVFCVKVYYQDLSADTTITVYLSNDAGNTWETDSETVGTGDGKIKSKLFHFIETGQYFQVKIEESSTSKEFCIVGAELMVYPRGDWRDF